MTPVTTNTPTLDRIKKPAIGAQGSSGTVSHNGLQFNRTFANPANSVPSVTMGGLKSSFDRGASQCGGPSVEEALTKLNPGRGSLTGETESTRTGVRRASV